MPVSRPARNTGGVTHWKLVPVPHGFAWRPLTPKKNRPSLLPSTPPALTRKPEDALALGVPAAESVAWHPLAETPAVQ